MGLTLRHSILAVVGCAAVIGAGCSSDETASTDPIIVVETLPETTTQVGAATGATESTAAAADSPASTTDEEKITEFSQCMRDSGVEAFETPAVAADGSVNMFADSAQAAEVTSDPEFNAAYEGCVSLLEGASFMTDQSESEAEDSLVQLAACLRERGIEVDDPNFDAEDPNDVFGADLDPNDPVVNEAVSECSQQVYTETPDGQ